MKITPFDQILCRTPAFGINETLASSFDVLKSKIEESSPTFYSLIKSLKFDDLARMHDKTKFTIWKYFNRAQYRSTPFGSFATVTPIQLSFAETSPIVLQNEMKIYQWIDWSEKEKYSENDLVRIQALCSNASVYFVDQEIRYIKTNEGRFELAAVNDLPELNAIIITCRSKTQPDVIYEMMRDSFDLDEQSTRHLLLQMIDLQLLQTDSQPNITGEDYFTKMGINCPPRPSNYIIAERTALDGNFDGKVLKYLPDMVGFFTKVFSPQESVDLTKFKQDFTKRFEGLEVSLAIAMDPEIGIGYGDLAQASNADLLVQEISALKTGSLQESVSYGKLQQFLLSGIIAQKPIELADFKAFNKVVASLPNTFSLMFHVYNGQPVLAQVGGCTANALLGRFTMSNGSMETLGKTIAKVEIDANPAVLFFDIAYQAEKKVDNVNRRKRLYPHELPILTWSDTAEPLDFTDIIVAVEHNEVILKSKKLGMRIMPRIPSAYNYNRSDLSVYRFLCDIQSQGLLPNLSFKLQDFFPNLAHYPRVSYKGIVISPAMWLMPPSTIQSFTDLKDWLMRMKIELPFKVGTTDQSLTFDPSNVVDLDALLNFGRQQKSDIYLTEALLSSEDYIQDEQGNVFSPQYIVNYYHQNELYKGSAPKVNQPIQRHLPGAEWLYFEIYSHSSKSNYLLLGLISQFLKANKAALKKWFFIRYTDPAPHLRLRLHLKNKELGFVLMNSLQLLIDHEMSIGFVNDFKLQTYQPEIQRYGAARMELVEQFFNRDSEYAIGQIKLSDNEEQLMINAVLWVKQLLEGWTTDLALQIKFAKAMAHSFAHEMNLEAVVFKKINANYHQLKGSLEKASLTGRTTFVKRKEAILNRILATCENNEVKQQLMADLIHMHINRLFISEQRVYETIIYHYLLRYLQTKLALSKVLTE